MNAGGDSIAAVAIPVPIAVATPSAAVTVAVAIPVVVVLIPIPIVVVLILVLTLTVILVLIAVRFDALVVDRDCEKRPDGTAQFNDDRVSRFEAYRALDVIRFAGEIPRSQNLFAIERDDSAGDMCGQSVYASIEHAQRVTRSGVRDVELVG